MSEWINMKTLPPFFEPVLVDFGNSDYSVLIRYYQGWAYNHENTLVRLKPEEVEDIKRWRFIEEE